MEDDVTPDELDEAIRRTLDLYTFYALDPSRRPKPTAKQLIGEIAQMLSELSEKLIDLEEVL